MSKEYKKVVTPEFILCFQNLFKPKAFEGTDTEKYDCVMVFPKGSDLTKLKDAAKEAIQKKFPNGAKGGRSPFRDGNEVADEWGDAFRDATFIRASSQVKPAIVDRCKRPITDEEQIYSGCIARAVVHAYGYDTKGNRGVSFGLDAVQFIRDGEPLGGGAASVGMFDDLGDDSGKSGETSDGSDDGNDLFD